MDDVTRLGYDRRSQGVVTMLLPGFLRTRVREAAWNGPGISRYVGLANTERGRKGCWKEGAEAGWMGSPLVKDATDSPYRQRGLAKTRLSLISMHKHADPRAVPHPVQVRCTVGTGMYRQAAAKGAMIQHG